MKRLITSESVTEGHPDKICDQISDAILDACLEQDKNSRVGIEATVKTVNGNQEESGEHVLLAGEITTNAKLDYEKIVRSTLEEIGYTDSAFGMDYKKVEVIRWINSQSADIAQGVDVFNGHEEGAGDQGMMFGYACNETHQLMPLSIALAHDLTRKLAEVRKKGIISYLGPDGKSQVTVEYEGDVPKRLDTIVIAQQHTEEMGEEELRARIKEEVVIPVCENYGLDDKTVIRVNTTGKFTIGGPEGDAGETGRKIIADTYGGVGRHGGGAFSGKDPTKVDRSGAYAARYIAKNIVASEIAKKCEVQLSYAIGVAEPTGINVDCFGTTPWSEGRILALIKGNFPLKPADILEELDLRRPIYKKTSCYGHFGRSGPEFTWEKPCYNFLHNVHPPKR